MVAERLRISSEISWIQSFCRSDPSEIPSTASETPRLAALAESIWLSTWAVVEDTCSLNEDIRSTMSSHSRSSSQ